MDYTNSFNGMIVSVGSDPDVTKNGIYRLFDPEHPGKDDIPDVTKAESWHKLVEFADLQLYLNGIGGYIIVQTVEERNSLSADSLLEGTEVYVVELDISYRWRNNAWVQIPSGSGSGNTSFATKEQAGIVKVGLHLVVDSTGTISVDVVDNVASDEARPVSSKAVYNYVEEKIGDIDAVLSKI